MPFSFLYLPRDACGHSGAPASVLYRFSTPTPYYTTNTHTEECTIRDHQLLQWPIWGTPKLLLSSKSVHTVPFSNTRTGWSHAHVFPHDFILLIMINETTALKSSNNLTKQLLINKSSSRLSKGSHPIIPSLFLWLRTKQLMPVLLKMLLKIHLTFYYSIWHPRCRLQMTQPTVWFQKQNTPLPLLFLLIKS